MQASLRAVILDFGNVLSMPQDPERFERMRRLAGADEESFRSAYRAPRLDYDRGRLDSAGYWREVLRRAGGSAPERVRTEEELVEEMTRIDLESWTVIRPAMVEWVHRLKERGFQTAILSNMPEDHASAIERTFDWLVFFDVRLYSYSVRLVKPEAAIYEECRRRLGVAASEALFIDDIPRNVDGARSIGMQSRLFIDEATLLAQLRELGGLPEASRTRLLEAASVLAQTDVDGRELRD